MSALPVLAPAKINLALHVTGRRDDGYHLIETLVAFSRFGDRLTVADAVEDSLSVSGPFAAGVPTGASNLVGRAIVGMRSIASRPTPISVHLEKNLPVASGIGGGSSDAAAAIRALADRWCVDLDDPRLQALAQVLGADVPMCLAARPLVARGVGERIEPMDGFEAVGAVLVNPGVAVPTPSVFAALDRHDGTGLPPLPARLDFHGLCNWLEATRNDLEAPARLLAPDIGTALDALKRAGAHVARMSGSGATCFGLYESGNLAKRAAAAIRERRPGWFVASTRLMSSQEVPG